MEEKKWCVYTHTNNINGKKYVGITCNKPERRWRNGKGYILQQFYNAIQKYGWDNFTHEILFNNLTEKEANKKEIYLIEKLNTKSPNGYNMSSGGDSTCGFKMSEETKQKLSNDKIGFKHTKQARENMRKTNAQKKVVYQLNIKTNNIIREFESTSKALEIMSKETNTNHGRSYISKSARFFRYFAFGYKWVYKEDYDNKTDRYYIIIDNKIGRSI